MPTSVASPGQRRLRNSLRIFLPLGIGLVFLSGLDAFGQSPPRARNEAQLAAAIQAATKPTTIYFTPGARSLTLSGLKPRAPVTIDGQGAVLERLTINKSASIRLVNFELVAVHANGTDPFKILDSEGITLERLSVHGSLDDDPSNDTSAMQIRRSRNVKVVGLEFQQLANAVTHLDSENVLFADNYLHDIRMDGIRGGGTSNLTIERNYFTNFRPLPADHPDAIQVWNTNTKAPASNILIRNNLIARGAGLPMQGIFVTAQSSRLRYQGVVIRDNLVIGSLYHGITVSGADGVTLVDNTVLTYPDIGARISVDKATDVAMTANAAPTFLRGADAKFSGDQRNRKTYVAKDRGASAIKAWLDSNPANPGARRP